MEEEYQRFEQARACRDLERARTFFALLEYEAENALRQETKARAFGCLEFIRDVAKREAEYFANVR